MIKIGYLNYQTKIRIQKTLEQKGFSKKEAIEKVVQMDKEYDDIFKKSIKKFTNELKEKK